MSTLLSFKSHDAFLCWCLLTSCAPLLRLFVSTSSNHYLSLTVIPLSFFLHMPSSGDCSSIIFLCPPMQFFSNIHSLLTLTIPHMFHCTSCQVHSTSNMVLYDHTFLHDLTFQIQDIFKLSH